MMRHAFMLALVSVAVASASLAQTAEPLIGVWQVDVFKSTYFTSQPPIKRTMTFEAVGESLKVTQETTNQGFNISETVKVEYTARMDGKDYPIVNSGLDTVALKRVDATTYERIGRIKGMQTETATMKLSNRNRTLTVTTKGTTDAGAEYARTEIFNKQ